MSDPRLVPGNHKPDLRPNELEPCGLADGVIFLRDDAGMHVREREALRYLRPMPTVWRVLNNQVGVCKPHFIHWLLPPDVAAAEEKENRPATWLFVSEDRCINIARDADKPERVKWTVHKVAEGIWAVLYG